MARDRNLARRNALAVPGALLAFYALVGFLYLAYRRGGACADAHRFLVAGTCYSALPLLAAALLVGLTLLGLGLWLLRGRAGFAVDRLQPGTPTHVAVALLASLVVVPALAAAVLAYLEGTQGITFGTRLLGQRFHTNFLLGVAAAVALLALLPMLATLAAQGARRRSFLRAAGEETMPPPAFPGAPGPEQATATAPPEEFVDESQWPQGREDKGTAPPQNP